MPEVIVDVMHAQKAMPACAQRAGACLMLSTMLHSIAVCNMRELADEPVSER